MPQYPARSPLEDVLRLVMPGSDGYVTEQYAAELALVLRQWSAGFRSSDLRELSHSLAGSVQSCSLTPAKVTPLRARYGVACERREYATDVTPGADHLLAQLKAWIGPTVRVAYAEMEITSIDEIGSAPLAVRTRVRYNVVAGGPDAHREQRVGYWRMEWLRGEAGGSAAARWTLQRFEAEPETRCRVHGPGFADVTEQALGGVPSYAAQLRRGADDWRTVLDGACGIDVYGNNGIAAGDFDNDGFDDLYVCQPAGLPNRLLRNRGDGTFEDVTEKAGVGVLDNTACALFADLRNVGLQDLLVVTGSGPLLFVNAGDGTFALKRDAFHFAQPPQGSFTHAAVADYDGDGRLDIYFCVYSYYLGLDQYHYPVPYFDARNGPPNFLLHNEGDARFSDRTAAAGLHADNDRYSFACAWGASAGNTLPDLYVVNDFGRANFYRNEGEGTFAVTSTKAHLEDVGAGMSACWADVDNDGRLDAYAANMWSAAGQRVSAEKRFHPDAPAATRDLYQRHARGNALYKNLGDGVFQSIAEQAGVAAGRWAWGSDFWDFDHDGLPDLYVANGYITAPAPQAGSAAEAGPDLGSFFWRQVVGRSPEDATPLLAYERGWNALNELIRSDRSWSGAERNVMLANNGDGTFAEISGAVGLDCIEDSRSFALADLDGDGRLEVVLKNRNAPQLRILHNFMPELGRSIAFRLRGTKSNRDAIGAAVTVTTGALRQTKWLNAGTGFLAQHGKQLFFGLGTSADAVHAEVRWPSGLVQQFDDLPASSCISLEEGVATFTAKPFRAKTPYLLHEAGGAAPVPDAVAVQPYTWLLDPLDAPDFALPDATGAIHTLASMRGRVTLLHLWATGSPQCRDQLQVLQRESPALAQAGVQLVAINIDPEASAAQARTLAREAKLTFLSLFATDEVAGVYNIIFRYLFDRRRDLALLTSLLLDTAGRIVKVYGGPVPTDTLLADARSLPQTPAERMRKALPFPGKLYGGSFARNDFTYGVAMFQHGYFEHAAASFQQVVAAHPDDAEGYYNLGTLSLRRNNFAEARQYLEKALQLKPNYPEAWNNLGMMAAQEGHADQAVQNFQRTLELRPNFATALLNLGNVYRRQRNFAEAQSCLLRALALQPDDPEANYSLGLLYAQQNQPGQAERYLLAAVTLRPDYPEALNNLGVLYVHGGDYAKAQAQFVACTERVPDYEESYLNLARLYLQQGDKVKAKQTVEDLLRRRPDSAAGKSALQALESLP